MAHYPGLMENRLPHLGKQHTKDPQLCWCNQENGMNYQIILWIDGSCGTCGSCGYGQLVVMGPAYGQSSDYKIKCVHCNDYYPKNPALLPGHSPSKV